ncbi:MAG: hypothetical protein IJP38_05870 [Oscillospiraceae bacterium]|nr:hypothetical protein [Oscillospiraceae bacterium]
MSQAVVGGVTTNYTYYADGLRRTKTTNGVTTVHMWDGDNIIADLDGNYALKTGYARAHDLSTMYNADGDEWYYIMSDRGDTIQMYNDTTETNYLYDAYGNQQTETTTDINPFRYCGEYYDEETGFIYLRARYYDPTIGRFTTEDPIRDGLNWYVYCENNPVNRIDPSGLQVVLMGSQDENQSLFNHMQSLTRDELSYEIDEYGQWRVFYEAVDGIKYNAGTELIREVIDNIYTSWIYVDNAKGSGAKPIIRQNASNPKQGTGAIIRINTTEQKDFALVERIDGAASNQAIPTNIALGHELIHAARWMNGGFIEYDSSNKSDYVYYGYESDSYGNLAYSFAPAEELSTVGISYDQGYMPFVTSNGTVITENILRQEQGYAKRVRYVE